MFLTSFEDELSKLAEGPIVPGDIPIKTPPMARGPSTSTPADVIKPSKPPAPPKPVMTESEYLRRHMAKGQSSDKLTPWGPKKVSPPQTGMTPAQQENIRRWGPLDKKPPMPRYTSPEEWAAKKRTILWEPTRYEKERELNPAKYNREEWLKHNQKTRHGFPVREFGSADQQWHNYLKSQGRLDEYKKPGWDAPKKQPGMLKAIVRKRMQQQQQGKEQKGK